VGHFLCFWAYAGLSGHTDGGVGVEICLGMAHLNLDMPKRPIFALPKETYICSAKRDLYLLCQKRPIFGTSQPPQPHLPWMADLTLDMPKETYICSKRDML